MTVARYIGVALAMAILAYLATVYNLAGAALERGDAVAALQWRPNSSEAASVMAEQALVKGDLETARRYARQALRTTPRDVRALRVLGLAEQMQGRQAVAVKLLSAAGALSWRDDPTEIWMIQESVKAGDYRTASERIDAMLRRGQRLGPMLLALHAMASIPGAREEVVTRLLDNPSWRRAFFVKTEYLPPGLFASHAALLDQMRTREGPLPREEVAWFISRLINSGDYAQARSVWLANLPQTDRANASTIYDGDFTRTGSLDDDGPRYPFEWSLESDNGAFASIENPPMLVNESSLAVTVQESAGSNLAAQTILLAPGEHFLRYNTLKNVDATPDAFKWRILCLPRGGPVELTPSSDRAVGSWQEKTFRFTIPEASCGAQNLVLGAATHGDHAAKAWFDHVRIN